MSPQGETALFILAWGVTLLRLPPILKLRAWQSNLVAFLTWVACLCFAISMTFLAGLVGVPFDAWSVNNLSRLIAYVSVCLTLTLIAYSSTIAIPTRLGPALRRLIAAGFLLVITIQVGLYWRDISQAPQWVGHYLPADRSEAVFMSVTYLYLLLLCLVLVGNNGQYLKTEVVRLARLRGWLVVLTSWAAAAFFLVKLLLVLAFFLPLPVGILSDWSNTLMVVSALLWAVSMMSNKVYLGVLSIIKDLRNWLVYQDLRRILARLELLCPPVSLLDESPHLLQFLRQSDYYLYRALVQIMDGMVQLGDELNGLGKQELSKLWDTQQVAQAEQVHRVLGSVPTNLDFWALITAYRQAGSQLLPGSFSESMPA